MALLKEGYKNQYGTGEVYWRILGINVNAQFKFCDITVGGYLTQEARDTDAEPMNVRKVRAKWSEDEYFKYFSPKVLEQRSLYEMAYEYLKQDPFFENCINI